MELVEPLFYSKLRAILDCYLMERQKTESLIFLRVAVLEMCNASRATTQITKLFVNVRQSSRQRFQHCRTKAHFIQQYEYRRFVSCFCIYRCFCSPNFMHTQMFRKYWSKARFIYSFQLFHHLLIRINSVEALYFILVLLQWVQFWLFSVVTCCMFAV